LVQRNSPRLKARSGLFRFLDVAREGKIR
jgi:hypothetical protein